MILILSSPFFFPQKEDAPNDPFSGITICHTPDDDDMSQFVNETGFKSFHPSPIAFDLDAKGEMVRYPTTDGLKGSGYLIKSSMPSEKWLFVYQEWWELNDHIKHQAEVFNDDLDGKVNVFALDMSDGKVTTNPQEAGQILQSLKEDRLEQLVNGA